MIICIVVLEHVMLGLRSAMTHLLPDLPSWLATEIARAEHIRREILTKESSTVNSRSSTPFKTSLRDLHNEKLSTSTPPEAAGTDPLVFHHIAPLEKPFVKPNNIVTEHEAKEEEASSSKPSTNQVCKLSRLDGIFISKLFALQKTPTSMELLQDILDSSPKR